MNKAVAEVVLILLLTCMLVSGGIKLSLADSGPSTGYRLTPIIGVAAARSFPSNWDPQTGTEDGQLEFVYSYTITVSGPIYIRADGSIDPPTAPIQRNGDIYTLTGNITSSADGIVVERDNTVVDGAGHKIQGLGSGCGIMVNKYPDGSPENQISNVTIRNSTVELFETGIGLYYANGCTVSDNTLTGNGNGILTLSDNSPYGIIVMSNILIARNIVSNNTNGIVFGTYVTQSSVSNNNITNNVNGITFWYGWLNTVNRNRILSTGYGILVYHGGSRYGSVYPSSSNSIDQNEITAGTFGIEFVGCTENNITRNTITAKDDAIHFLTGVYWEIVDCSGNNIANNTLTSTNADAILLESSVGNHIENNDVRVTNGNCINLTCSSIMDAGGTTYIRPSSNNTLAANRLTTTTGYDVALFNSSSNTIYHNNFLNIGHEVHSEYSLNTWDNGYPSGGNYWSDYTNVDSFKGPSQNVPGSDGIWDHSYVIDANNKDRYPLVNPWVPEEPCMVVRGLDSRIYYRVWNGAVWGDWMSLPGSTVDSAAAARYGNGLHIVVRGSDSHTLWYGYLTNPADPTSFSGWSLLSGATSSAPTLTSNGTVLCLVVRGQDNCIYYRCYSEGVWGQWYAVPTGATPDAPTASMLGNDLHIVVRGMDGSSLWDTIVSCNGSVVRNWSLVSGATPSKPVLACSGLDNLCLVVRGMDNTVYYRNDTGSTDSWAGWSAFPTGATIDGPAATVMGSELCVVVRGLDGNTLWCGDVDLGTSGFLGWTLLSGATPSTPTLTS